MSVAACLGAAGWLAASARAQTPLSSALFVTTSLNLNGWTPTFDSFQSTNTALFPNGLWNATNRRDHGNISTTATNSSSVNLQNVKVRGTIHTPPSWTATSANIGTAGSVGDNAWVDGGYTGIEPGHTNDDVTAVLGDATLPNTGGRIWRAATPGSTVINGVTYQYVLTSNSPWRIDAASLTGSIYVLGTNVQLWLSGGAATIGSGSTIEVPNIHDAYDNPYSLAMYVSATSFTLNGTGYVNESGIARNLQYYGLPSNIAMTLRGNANFTALIYAPEANFTLGGGASATYDFTGCAVTKSFNLNGHFNFHFDEGVDTYALFPPWITAQPQDRVVLAGQDAIFTMLAGGPPPITYQWRFNTTNIVSTATNTLTLTNATLNQAGIYDVVISNAYGSVTSAPAMLSVYASAAAVLAPSFDSVSNQFQISVAGVPGFNYAIQASTNLSDWISLLTNASPFTYLDADTGGFPQRFYRSVYLP